MFQVLCSKLKLKGYKALGRVLNSITNQHNGLKIAKFCQTVSNSWSI